MRQGRRSPCGGLDGWRTDPQDACWLFPHLSRSTTMDMFSFLDEPDEKLLGTGKAQAAA